MTTETALPEAPASPPCPHPRRPVRVAVVGLGRAGVGHLAVLSTVTNCELVGFADPQRDVRRIVKGMGFSARRYSDVEKLLKKTRPDAVFVCAPHRDRARVAGLALEAGAAVLVDRLLAATLPEAEGLARLAAEKSLQLAGGFPLAYHPVFVHAHRALTLGVLGATRQVRCSSYASRVFNLRQKQVHAPPQSPGGVVAQNACDLLFLLIWYLGPPVEVRATWNKLYGEFEDELHAMMTLPSGAEVGFDASWSVPGHPRQGTVIELDGENGKLLASDDALELDLFEPRQGVAARHVRLVHAGLPQMARFSFDGEGLYVQDATFLAWVTGGEPPPNRTETALQVSRVLDALYASARGGGRATAVPS